MNGLSTYASVVVASAVVLASCASGDEAVRPGSSSSEEIFRLFAEIEVGASRSTVEESLGAPKHEHTEGPMGDMRVAWYLDPPALDPVESPYAPGAIEVRYMLDRVVAKSVNPQVRR
jgi:hypothetical protein